jgi:ribose 5-phosphate isomerase A
MERSQKDLKYRAAIQAIDFIHPGQIVGLGTGSTVYFALVELGRRVREGLDIVGIPTSEATERIAREFGIPIVPLTEIQEVDVVIDGADEIDEKFNMIKGGGGALTREKLVALAGKNRVIIIDESKLVLKLGSKSRLPIEILPYAWAQVEKKLKDLNCRPTLRRNEDKIFETDNGNYIFDCQFKEINHPVELDKRIKLISGVVESGLFLGIADILIIGSSGKVEVRFRN